MTRQSASKWDGVLASCLVVAHGRAGVARDDTLRAQRPGSHNRQDYRPQDYRPQDYRLQYYRPTVGRGRQRAPRWE